MFISELKHTIEAYDPYGIHRLNGFKVVYVLFILFAFNMLFNLSNPYFYYFYLPITAMTAEVMVDKIEDKYNLFIYTILGSCVMVFLFNMMRPYPFFFLLTMFSATVLLYFIALRWARLMVPLVPVILSLAAYSLLYPSLSLNFRMVLNNLYTTIFAMLVMVGALVLFPLSYYYRLWLRSFLYACQDMLDVLVFIRDEKPVHFALQQENTKRMVGFGAMLPRRLPVHTILKINLLCHRLILDFSLKDHEVSAYTPDELELLIWNMKLLIISIKDETPCRLIYTHNPIFKKLIHAWNELCSKQ